jgi:hypothetical protein
LDVRLRRSERSLRLNERRFPIGAIELYQQVALFDDVAFADVNLRDPRCDAARDVDVDPFDNAAAASGPVLGGTKMPHSQDKGDEQSNCEHADEDQSAFHDGLLATSRPVA